MKHPLIPGERKALSSAGQAIRFLSAVIAVVLALGSLAPRAAAEPPSMKSYDEALESVRSSYPFPRWAKSGLSQYTPKACAAFASIFDGLIARLISLGSGASEEKKLQLFREAIEALNSLNEQDPSLIETGEREDLCELCNRIAVAAGLDPKKFGDGEGPASEWREW